MPKSLTSSGAGSGVLLPSAQSDNSIPNYEFIYEQGNLGNLIQQLKNLVTGDNTGNNTSNNNAPKAGAGSKKSSSKSSKWDNLTPTQKKNAIYLYNTLISYGFTDTESRAILGVVSKESVFEPKNEIPYTNTSATRIKEVFPSVFGSYTNNQIDVIKKDSTKFWDLVYGYKKPLNKKKKPVRSTKQEKEDSKT